MKKPFVPLLVLAVVLAVAPAAMAECLRCRPIQHLCEPTTVGGFEYCVWGTITCSVDWYCYDQAPPTVAPLASEFVVASVERLDEPHTVAPETLVASTATLAPKTR